LFAVEFVCGNIYHNRQKKLFNFFITFFLVSHFWVIKKNRFYITTDDYDNNLLDIYTIIQQGHCFFDFIFIIPSVSSYSHAEE